MNKQIIEALQWRYAVKKFDAAKKISEENWQTLAESLRLSASSYGFQPWKFLVVQNPEVRKQLRNFSWNQSQVEDCSHLVVFAFLKKIDLNYVDRYIRRMVEVRGGTAENYKGFRDNANAKLLTGRRANDLDHWAERQSFIAMGQLLETAALLKVDSCPMEGIEPAEYDRILGLENSEYQTIAAVALGYRHPEDKYQHLPKVRFSQEEIIQIID